MNSWLYASQLRGGNAKRPPERLTRTPRPGDDTVYTPTIYRETEGTIGIDAAKTGDDCTYPKEEKKIIDAAVGGKIMPYFFQFSKNGRRITNYKEVEFNDED